MPNPNAFDSLLTEELLLRCRDGSQDAWREVYRRYRTFLSIAANSVAGVKAQDVDDVLQSAFLSAWKEIEDFSYRGKNSFRAWLRSIVINKNLNEIRKRARRAQVRDQNQMGTAWIASVTDHGAQDPKIAAAEADAQQQFFQILDSHLDDLEREIVTLRYFERLQLAQIAEVVELDPRTVRRRLRAAMDRIQRELSD